MLVCSQQGGRMPPVMPCRRVKRLARGTRAAIRSEIARQAPDFTGRLPLLPPEPVPGYLCYSFAVPE